MLRGFRSEQSGNDIVRLKQSPLGHRAMHCAGAFSVFWSARVALVRFLLLAWFVIRGSRKEVSKNIWPVLGLV